MTDNQEDHKTTKDQFAEWFEANVKTGNIAADFFRLEDDEGMQ